MRPRLALAGTWLPRRMRSGRSWQCPWHASQPLIPVALSWHRARCLNGRLSLLGTRDARYRGSACGGDGGDLDADDNIRRCEALARRGASVPRLRGRRRARTPAVAGRHCQQAPPLRPLPLSRALAAVRRRCRASSPRSGRAWARPVNTSPPPCLARFFPNFPVLARACLRCLERSHLVLTSPSACSEYALGI